MESLEAKKARADKIYAVLLKQYPDARTLLEYRNAFELLAATILAAQCTDERVNRTTPDLFAKYPGPRELARARQEDVEEIIRPTGFYHNKAKSVIAMSDALVERFGGRVPDNMEDLASLPGVGRKTAGVILAAIHDKPAIIVDTHCRRVSARLGFTESSDPDRIERDIAEAVPEKRWSKWSFLMSFHGRRICKAPKPLCPKCPVNSLCAFPNKTE